MICCWLSCLYDGCDGIVQHIRKYLQELLSLISELWSSFTFPAPVRPPLGYAVSMGYSCKLGWIFKDFSTFLNDIFFFLECFRFSTWLNNFAWLSMMNSEHIFRLFCQVAFRSLVMLKGAMTTLMFSTFSTPLKCLVVSSIFCYISHIFKNFT